MGFFCTERNSLERLLLSSFANKHAPMHIHFPTLSDKKRLDSGPFWPSFLVLGTNPIKENLCPHSRLIVWDWKRELENEEQHENLLRRTTSSHAFFTRNISVSLVCNHNLTCSKHAGMLKTRNSYPSHQNL